MGKWQMSPQLQAKKLSSPKLARMNPGVSERLDPSDHCMARAVFNFSNYGPPEKSVVAGRGSSGLVETLTSDCTLDHDRMVD